MAKLGTPEYGNQTAAPRKAIQSFIADEPLIIDGECPTCGQRIKPEPLSAAAKQKRYRARKANAK